MSELLFNIGFLITGLYVLKKGADFLIDGGASLANKLRISHLVIGLTIISLGTSMPEMFVTVLGNLAGNPEIAIGSIISSNITNLLLILGITAIFFPLAVTKDSVFIGLPYSVIAILTIVVMVSSNALTLFPGHALVLLILFVIFFVYVFWLSRKTFLANGEKKIEIPKFSALKSLMYITTGSILLYFSTNWIIDSAVFISNVLEISQTSIAAILALGTSLPELSTTFAATKKKASNIAVGNIVGSNIFNILFVLGVTSFIKPLVFEPVHINDMYILVGINFITIGLILLGKKYKITRIEGFTLLILYLIYLVYLISREAF